MNISIKNENVSVMNYLNVEIIKTIDGLFTREDIERELNNLYYNKVIIDITAIKNYYDEDTLFDFLSFWEPSRVVLVLNNTEFCNSSLFLKKLVEKGYYNFSKNASGISFLINKPNTFEDVKKYLEGANLYNPMNSNEITAEDDYRVNKNREQKIIGIQSLTPHAGSTTLMYMMVKVLKNNYKVKGIEYLKNDNLYLKSDDLINSESLEDLKIKINTLYNFDVIIIDLNGLNEPGICNETLYLIEPGTIRLNKYLKVNRDFSALSNKKIILSRSMISDKDLNNFIYESKINVFHNLRDFNDRDNSSQTVKELLAKLGFNVR